MKVLDKIHSTLAPLYESVASAQESSGRFRTPSMGYTVYGQYTGIFFAWLYTLDSPDNRFFGDADTLSHAIRGWDFYATQISPEGEARIVTYDQFWSDAVDEWGCYYWMNTQELLRPFLERETVDRWTECITRIVAKLAGNIERAVADPEFNTALSRGSASNHFVWSILCLYRHAMINNDAALRARYRGIMGNVLRHQLPAGTWMEGDTLVTGYGEVTICAVSLFEIYDENPAAAAAVRKNLDFRLQTLYPNFLGNDCLEGRTGYSKDIFPYTAPTFCLYPEGRGYFLRWIDYLKNNQPIGWKLDQALQGLAVISDLAIQMRTMEGEDEAVVSIPTATVSWPELETRILRSEGWTVTMCGLCPSSHKSRWIMERQNLLSVFEEEGGLVIGGGHSIGHPEFSTFNIISRGTLHYLHKSGKLTGDGMTLQYGNHICHVEARITNGTVHLRYSVEDIGETERALVNLPVWTEDVSWCSFGNRKLPLGKDVLSAELPAGEGLILGSINVVSNSASCLRYPSRPFNPYHKNRTVNSGSIVQAVLTVELNSDFFACEVIISRTNS